MASLSQSNEDYLEAILVVGLEQGIVRVKDLAQHLHVKAPSVVTAVKKLAGEGLVRHESYGHVELTPQGLELAQDIHNKHKLLFRFLNSFLGLDEDTAERDACEIEHGLSTQTIDRIIQFLEFIEACPAEEEPRWLLAFRHFIATGDLPQSCQYLAGHISFLPESTALESDPSTTATDDSAMTPTSLDSLSTDQEAEVVHVSGEARLKRRFLDMGIVPGTKLSVRNVAPLGDPIDIVVRGYHLSLRKQEAARISVRLVDQEANPSPQR